MTFEFRWNYVLERDRRKNRIQKVFENMRRKNFEIKHLCSFRMIDYAEEKDEYTEDALFWLTSKNKREYQRVLVWHGIVTGYKQTTNKKIDWFVALNMTHLTNAQIIKRFFELSSPSIAILISLAETMPVLGDVEMIYVLLRESGYQRKEITDILGWKEASLSKLEFNVKMKAEWLARFNFWADRIREMAEPEPVKLKTSKKLPPDKYMKKKRARVQW